MLLLVPLPPWTEDITTMMTSVHIAPPLAVIPTMKVETAMAVEVVEMTEPSEPRPAAIKLLGPNPVTVARPIGVVRTSSFGAGRESSQQDD